VVQARTGDPQAACAAIGTLSPVHAVAMPAILVLPALAWLLGRMSSAGPVDGDGHRRMRSSPWSPSS
jgi:hypothetical protein